MKFFKYFVVCFFIISNICFSASYSGGSGTSADPYLISNRTDLESLMDPANSADWSATFSLTTNIDCSSSTYTRTIGTSSTIFTGYFDGQIHTISNLTIYLPADNYVGLFGISTGSIINLNLSNANITGTDNVGGLLGRCDNTTIINCSSSGTISGNANIGGLIGYMYYGTISNCSSTITVSGDSQVGGLIGFVNNCMISYCSSSGNVMGHAMIGGLIGYDDTGTIYNCYFNGSVMGNSSCYYIGGLIGWSVSGSLTNCYSMGSVQGNQLTGGLIGYDMVTSITNCYSTCSVQGDMHSGGLVGMVSGGIINNCYTNCQIVSASSSFSGGLFGHAAVVIVNDSYSNSYVSAPINAGGYAGGASSTTFNDCYESGFVTGSSTFGGFCGADDVSNLYICSYWNSDINSGMNGTGNNGNPSGLTGLSDANMRSSSTFISCGWDFSSIWYSDAIHYPLLRYSLPVFSGPHNAYVMPWTSHTFTSSVANADTYVWQIADRTTWNDISEVNWTDLTGNAGYTGASTTALGIPNVGWLSTRLYRLLAIDTNVANAWVASNPAYLHVEYFTNLDDSSYISSKYSYDENFELLFFSNDSTQCKEGLKYLQNSYAAWGDYNNDGYLDLAMCGEYIDFHLISEYVWYDSIPNTIIYLNVPGDVCPASRTFSNSGITLPGVKKGCVVWNDYNNDGYLDLFLSGETNSGTITQLYQNDGSGGFSLVAGFNPTPVSNCSAAWGDYNNDGYQDVVIIGETSSGTPLTQLWKNNGDGTFDLVSSNATNFPNVSKGSVAWGDYNKDGRMDLLICGYMSYQSYTTNVFRNWTTLTSTSFSNVNSNIMTEGEGEAAWGDFNQDGYLDFAMTGNHYWYPYEAIKIYNYEPSSGTFVENSSDYGLGGVKNASLAIGDFDNSGSADFFTTGYGSSSYTGYNATLYTNEFNHFSNFYHQYFIPLTNGKSTFADYDNDGDLDLLMTGLMHNVPVPTYAHVGDGEISFIGYTDFDLPYTTLYINNENVKNTPPDTVSNLHTTQYNPLEITLDWSKATDAETSQNGLSYNVYIWNYTTSSYGLSAMSDYSGFHQIPVLGNVGQSNTWTLNLPQGDYEYGVQSIDNNYIGSAFVYGLFTVYDLPTFTLSPTSVTVCPGGSQVFSATVTNSNEYRWQTLMSQWVDVTNETSSGAVYSGGSTTQLTLSSIPKEFTPQMFRLLARNHLAPFTWSASNPATLYLKGFPVFNPSPQSATVEAWLGTSFSSTVTQSAGSIIYYQWQIAKPGETSWANLVDGIGYGTTFTNTHGELNTTNFSSTLNIARVYGLNQYQFRLGITNNICPDFVYPSTTAILTVPMPFIDSQIDIAQLQYSSVAWGDYDNDGYLDLAVCGWDNTKPDSAKVVTKLYKNVYLTSTSRTLTENSSTFTSSSGTFYTQAITLPNVQKGALAWGDYNNDGYLDLIITGLNDSGTPITKIFQNTPYSTTFTRGSETFTCVSRTFTEVTNYGSAPLTGLYNSSVKWVDYNNDGMLDFIITGMNNSSQTFTKLYRNDNASKTYTGYASASFTEVTTNLPNVSAGTTAWADYNKDGFMDVIITGYASASYSYSRVYKNEAGSGSFTLVANLQPAYESSAIWFDYNNDGYPDVMQQGWAIGMPWAYTKLYRNEAGSGSFTEISTNIPNLRSGTIVAGDYNNDGKQDIIISGYALDNSFNSAIFRNEGVYTSTSASFTNVLFDLPIVMYSSIAFGDYNNDGILDLAYTGSKNDYLSMGKIYYGFQYTTNKRPAAPTSLSSQQYNANSITLWWTKSADADNTPTVALTSNIYIGKTSTDCKIESPMAVTSTTATNNGWRRVVDFGNASESNTWTINNIPAGSYTWSAQTIDNGFLASPFATSATFSVTPIPTFTTPNISSSPVCPSTSSTITLTSTVTNATVYKWQIYYNSSWYDCSSDSYSGITYTGLATTKLTISNFNSNVQGSLFRILAQNSGIPPTWSSSNSATLTLTSAPQFTVQPQSVTLYPGANWTFTPTISDANNCKWQIIKTGDVSWTDIASISGYSSTYSGVASTNLTITNITSNLVGFSYREVIWNSSCPSYFVASNTAIITISNMFSPVISTGLPNVKNGAIALGDYDKDGLLDVLISGETESKTITQVYRNLGSGSFTLVGSSIDSLTNGSVAWGDYNNDNLLDVLVCGRRSNGVPYTRLFRNNNGTTATEIASGVFTGVYNGNATFGDYNNDGKLDILITGKTLTGRVTEVYLNNGNNSFTKTYSLVGLEDSWASFVDYDKDGDLDILVSGNNGSSTITSYLYRNDLGVFTLVSTGLPSSSTFNAEKCGEFAFADNNSDGYLDLAMTGLVGSNTFTRVYTYSSGSYTEVAGLIGLQKSSIAWADYNNDGKQDLVVMGTSNGTDRQAMVYRNDGSNTFTKVMNLDGVANGRLALGDLNNDGAIDIITTGDNGSSPATKVYFNNTPTKNVNPLPPAGLTATVNCGEVSLSWNQANDVANAGGYLTPQASLNYNITVGTDLTTGNYYNTMSPMADISSTGTGLRYIAKIGNSLSNSYKLYNLPEGIYNWSVQSIDGVYTGSSFTSSSSFTITYQGDPVIVTPTISSNTVTNLGTSNTSATVCGLIPWTVASSATYTGRPSASYTPLYQWQKYYTTTNAWADIATSSTFTGVTTSLLTIDFSKEESPAYYRMLARAPYSCIYNAASTGTITITAISSPTISTQPSSATACVGTSAVLSSTVTNADAYQWQIKIGTGYNLVNRWGTEGSSNGQFETPTGIAVDNITGDVYVADSYNHRIQKFTSTGSFTLSSGTWGFGNGQFMLPQGIAVDANYVYVTDMLNHRIQILNKSTGAYVSQFGSLGTGGNNFNKPKGIAVNSTAIYVADMNNHRIQKLTLSGTTVSSNTFWGMNGSGNGQFLFPSDVAVDGLGNVYVADMGNQRIQKFDANGNYLTQWGSAGTATGQFQNPVSVATNNNNEVYVADYYNARVQKFASDGTYINSFGSLGSGDLQFNKPKYVGVNKTSDMVYVSDSLSNQIKAYQSNWINLATSSSFTGVTGSSFIGATSSPTLTITSVPTNLSGSSYRLLAGKVGCQYTWMATSSVVTLTVPTEPDYTTNQPANKTVCALEATTFASNPNNANSYSWQYAVSSVSAWVDVSTVSTSFTNWTTTALSINSNTISYGWNGYRFRLLSKNLGCPSAWGASAPATLTVLQSSIFSTNPSNKTVCNNETTNFTSVVTNGSQYKWQYQTSAGVVWADLSEGATTGSVSSTFTGVATQSLMIANATTDISGYKYRILTADYVCPTSGWYASTSATLTVTPIPVFPTVTVTSASVCRDVSYQLTTNPSPADTYLWQLMNPNIYDYVLKWGGTYGDQNSQFKNPTAVTEDDSNNVYVIDYFNYRIQKFDRNGNYITKWGMSGSDHSEFLMPNGIAYYNGYIYVADEYHGRIQKFDKYGNYQSEWSTDVAQTGTTMLGGMAISSGTFFFADNGNHRVIVFDANGNYINQWGSFGTGNSQFKYPNDITISKCGYVYVTDTYNNRIQVFQKDGTYINQWGTTGTGNGQFVQPLGITSNYEGKIFVLDNSRVQVFNESGVFISSSTFTSYGPSNEQTINSKGIEASTTGSVFITDYTNNRVERFEPTWHDVNCSATTTYANSTSFTGCQTGTLTIVNTTNLDNFKFRLLARYLGCPSASASSSWTAASTTTITVLNNPDFSASLTPVPSIQTACADASVTFTSTPATANVFKWQEWNTTTWIDISSTSGYSTTFSGYYNTMLVVNRTAGMNGYQFRLAAQNIYCPTSWMFSSPATLNVIPLPDFSSNHPANTTVCFADGFTFTSNPATASQYQWQMSENTGASWYNITNSLSTTYTIVGNTQLVGSATTGIMSGYQYRLIAKNLGCPSSYWIVSNPASLTVIALPDFTGNNPANKTVCSLEAISFTSTPNYSKAYLWQFSSNSGSTWLDVTNALYSASFTNGSGTTTTLSINNNTITPIWNGYQFRLLAKNFGCPVTYWMTSSPATLTVTSLPDFTGNNPSNKTVCTAENIVFSSSPINASTYSWQYSNGGGWLDASAYSTTFTNYNSQSLTVNSSVITPSWNNAQFRLLAKNLGCPTNNWIASASATLTVTLLPDFTGNNPTNKTVCSLESMTFTSNPNNANTYSWQFSTNSGVNWLDAASYSSSFTNYNTQSLIINSGVVAPSWNNAQFRLLAKNFGCPTNSWIASSAATLSVITLPDFTGNNPANMTVCSLESTTFTSNPNYANAYSWQYSTNSGSSWLDASAYSGSFTNYTTKSLSINNNVVTPTWNGYQFRLLAKNLSCPTNIWIASDASVLTVTSLPDFTESQPSNKTVCALESITFSSSPINANTYSWQYSTNSGSSWLDASAYSSSFTNYATQSLTINNSVVTPSWNNYQFRMLAKNYGCPTNNWVASNSAILSVITLPDFTGNNPANKTVCSLESITFTSNPNYSDAYSWQYSTNNGTAWLDASAYSSSFTNYSTKALSINSGVATPSWNAYQFRMLAKNLSCPTNTWIASSPATLNVVTLPDFTGNNPANKTVCSLESITFTSNPIYANAYSWQYSIDNGSNWIDASAFTTLFTNYNTQSLTINNSVVTPSWTGYQFRMLAKNLNCPSNIWIASSPATLSVTLLPVFSLTTTLPSTQSSCGVGSVTFTTFASPVTEYVWDYQKPGETTWNNVVNGTFLGATYTGQNTTQLVINGTLSGLNNYIYRLKARNYGCPTTYSTSSLSTLSVIPEPSFAIANPISMTACLNETYGIKSVPTPANEFQWQVQLIGNTSWQDVADGSLGPIIYWGSSTTQLVITNTSYSSDGNQYRLKARNLGCPATWIISNPATIHVPVNPVFGTDAPVSQTVCSNDQFAWTGKADNANDYHWQEFIGSAWFDVYDGVQFTGTSTTQLILLSTTGFNNTQFRLKADNDGCPSTYKYSNPVTLTVIEIPHFVTPPSPTYFTICSSETITLTCQPATADIFVWKVKKYGETSWTDLSNIGVSGVSFTGVTNTLLSISSVTTDMNNYQFKLFAKNDGCPTTWASSSAATMRVPQNPVFTSSITSTTVCNNSPYTLTIIPDNANSVRWQYLNGSLWTDLSESSLYTNVITYNLLINNTSGMEGYQFRLKAQNDGCPQSWVFSNVVTLHVSSDPSFSQAYPQPSMQVVCSSSSFTLTAYSSNATTYSWESNNGYVWTDLSASTLTYSGQTTSQLTVLNSTGLNGYQFRTKIQNSGCPTSWTYSQASVVTVLSDPDYTNQNPSNTTICINSSASLYSNPANANEYKWQLYKNSSWINVTDDNSGTIYSNINTTQLTISNTQIAISGYPFRMIARNNNCPNSWTASASAIIYVPTNPDWTGNNPQSQVICNGGSASFTAKPANADEYQWQFYDNASLTWYDLPNQGLFTGTNTTCLNISNIADLDNVTYFRLKARHNACPTTWSISATATLSIPNEPSFVNTQPSNQTVCTNTAIIITSNPTPANDLQWQQYSSNSWSNIIDGGIYSGATTTQLNITSLTTDLTQNIYRLKARNLTCPNLGNYSNAATITVLSDPYFNGYQPASHTVCLESSLTFTSMPYSANQLQWQEYVLVAGSYQWVDLVNTTPFSGVTTTSLYISDVNQIADQTQFRLLAKNHGCPATWVASNAAILTIPNRIDFTNRNPQNQFICLSSPANISSNPLYADSWQWQTFVSASWTNLSNAGVFSGVTTNLLTISNVSALDGTQYRLIAKNASCPMSWVASSSAVLTVSAEPIIQQIALSNSTVCSGSNVTITVTATSVTDYQWQSYSGGIWNNLTSSSLYSGVTSSQLTITNILSSLNGMQYRAIAQNNGCPVNWSSSSAVQITVYAMPTLSLNVPYTSVCQNSSTFNITATSDYTAALSIDGSVVSSGTSVSYLFNPSNYSVGSHTISLNCNNQGCSSSTTTTITVNSIPTISLIVPYTSVCQNSSTFNINGTSNYSATLTIDGLTVATGSSITYSYNPTVAGSHTVTLSSGNTGCSNSTSTIITVNTSPTLSLNVPYTTVCQNSSTFNITGNASTSGTMTIDGMVVGTGTSIIYNYNPTSVGFHTVIFSALNSSGCSSSSFTTITVNPIPTISLNVPYTTVCQNSSTFNITATASTSGTMTIDGMLVGTGTSIIYNYNPTSVGFHTVIFSSVNSYGCSSSSFTTITVNPVPTITLNVPYTTVCQYGSAFNITATASNSGTMTIDGMVVATGTSVTYSFNPTSSGFHTVIFSALNSSGCSSTSFTTITVNPVPTITLNVPYTTVCQNSSTFNIIATASISGTMTIDGMVVATGTNISYNYNPTLIGFHTVIFSTINSSGCSSSSWTTITVNAVPSVFLNVPYSSICQNSSTFSITGTASYSATLSIDGSSVATGTSISYTFNPISYTGGSHTITLISSNSGCSSSTTTTITVIANPSFTTQPVNQTISDGSSCTFTSLGSPNGITYQWQLSSNNTTWGNVVCSGVYSGCTTANLAISNVSALNGTYYRVIISNASCSNISLASNSALLTVTTATNLTRLQFLTQPTPIRTQVTGESFNVVVQAQDQNGNPMNVTSNLLVAVSKYSGDGSGTITSGGSGTITSGSNTCSINIIYTNDSGETNVVLAGTSGTLTAAISNSFTVCVARPITQATGLGFPGSPGSTYLRLSWTKGSGSARVIIAKHTTAFYQLTEQTQDGKYYNSNTNFGITPADTVGPTDSCYVVYNGTGESTTITNLATNTQYTFKVIEYNGTGSVTSYNTSVGSNRNGRQTRARYIVGNNGQDGPTPGNVDENQMNIAVSNIMPNPAKDKISFYLDLFEGNEINISIYSTDGRKVIDFYNQQHVGEGRHLIEIPLNHLTAGNYTILISSGDEAVVNRFIVLP